jgi:ferrous-iron efflux pump FieF
VQALVDAAPQGVEKEIVAAVEKLAGVIDCHNVRVRYSGPQAFVDVHISLDGEQTLHAAHDLTETVERTIQAVVQNADVTVHPEPVKVESTDKRH